MWQLDLFNPDENPAIIENRLYRPPTLDQWDPKLEVTVLKNRTSTPARICASSMNRLSNGTLDGNILLKFSVIEEVRTILTENLWNKDGSENVHFFSELSDHLHRLRAQTSPGVAIDYEDVHDPEQRVANVHIPNCDVITIIGKAGSC